MNGLKTNNIAGAEFFGAVSKNFKTLIGDSKRKIKNQIDRRGIAKNNIALFRCWLNGRKKIEKKLINRPRFRLQPHHHIVLERACFNFLSSVVGGLTKIY